MTKQTLKRWYVGISVFTMKYKAFQSEAEPTSQSHGLYYIAVIGPFITRRAAIWTQEHGKGNPHFCHVTDAERLCKNRNNWNSPTLAEVYCKGE